MNESQPKKRRGLRLFLIIIGILIACLAIFAFILYDFSNPDDLSEYLDRKFKKSHFAGLAVTLLDETGPVYFHGCGYADIEARKPVTPNTIFQIASISKSVTGTAVMQLAEDGLLDIDSDINTYLPLKIVNPHHPNQVITTRMLLTHTSSIRDNYDVYDPLYTLNSGGGDSPISLEEFVRGYMLEGGEWYYPDENFLEDSPGSVFDYSNCAYALLGYLVEQVSGQPFNVYCREHIFEPLGMANTGWFFTEVDMDKLAVPYNKERTAYPFYSFPTYPDGSLKTSSTDYAVFLRAMLNHGEYQDARILSENSLNEMLTPQVPGLKDDQGLAWFLRQPEEFYVDCDGHWVPGHSGGDEGVCTMAFFSPETNLGAILFINSDIRRLQIITLYQIVKRLTFEVIG